jgi:glyoxylase-like metal-dependent hydrolase (beta-lactamase superfamily II)
MKIGDYEILGVLDGEMRVPAAGMFGGKTEADWAPHKDLLDGEGRLGLTMGGFLIRGLPGRTVLVDLGLGGFEMGGAKIGGAMLRNLAERGVAPGDVTDVLFSHLHLDHVGWASEAGVPVFPKATYRCHQADWDYWITGSLDDISGVPAQFAIDQRTALEPVADRLETWNSDVTLFEGVSVQHAPGHTPGSSVVVVSSGAERAVLLGDAAHSPVELLEDTWPGLGDVDVELARRTRNACARELEGSDTLISAAHFPEMGFGRLIRAEGRRWWSPVTATG